MKAKKIKGILVKNGAHSAVEFKSGDIEAMRELIGCDTFSVIERRIGGRLYDLWIDDEFLLTCGDTFEITGALISGEYQELLGNGILILNHDGEDTASLTDDDVANIEANGIVNSSAAFRGNSVSLKYRTSCGTYTAALNPDMEFLAYGL